MKTNYHTHTYRCGHARGSDEQYVQAAIDAGLELVGFSDHMPIPKSVETYDRMTLEEFPYYLKSINNLKEKYQEQIEVLAGLECEWIAHDVPFLENLRNKCDYLILGNHERMIPSKQYDYTYYADDEAIELYCLESEAALNTGLFAFFAHPEYFMFGRRCFNDKCRWAAHFLAQICADLAIPMEINVNGFTRSHYIEGKWQPPYPFPEFWQIVSEYPVKIIYSFDAHRPIHMHRNDLIEAVNEHLGNLSFDIIERISVGK